MAVLYWKPCYNEVHYNEVGLYYELSTIIVCNKLSKNDYVEK